MTVEHRDDPHVVRALGESGVLRRANLAIDAVWRAAASSRTLSVVQRARDGWSRLPAAARDGRISIIVIVAVVTHVLLMLWQEQPPGWLWLMIPGIAVSIAAMLGARSAARG